jgi:hypothetical protein
MRALKNDFRLSFVQLDLSPNSYSFTFERMQVCEEMRSVSKHDRREGVIRISTAKVEERVPFIGSKNIGYHAPDRYRFADVLRGLAVGVVAALRGCNR